MRNWRVLTAVAAVVLAAVAGVLVWKYTDNAKKDAQRPFTQVEIYVANKTIPSGTSLAAAIKNGMISRQKFVQGDVPKTRLDPAQTEQQLTDDFGQYVASHNIGEGLPILRTDFVTAGSIQSGVAGQLDSDNADLAKQNKQKNLEAVTLTFDDEHSVGGFLNPGDHVNAIVHIEVKDLLNTKGNAQPVKVTAYLLENIKVLAVGSTTSAPQQTETTTPSGGTATPTTQATLSRGLITLEVTPRQAEQLVHAKAEGTLTLSLNPPSFKPGDFTTPEEIVEVTNLFDQPMTHLKDILNQIRALPVG